MDLKKKRTATTFFSLSLYPPPPPLPPRTWAPGRARKRGRWGAGWGGGRAQTAGGGGCGGRAGRWGRRGRRIEGAEARGALMGVDEDGVEVSSKILKRARRGTHTPPQRMRNFRRLFLQLFPNFFFMMRCFDEVGEIGGRGLRLPSSFCGFRVSEKSGKLVAKQVQIDEGAGLGRIRLSILKVYSSESKASSRSRQSFSLIP